MASILNSTIQPLGSNGKFSGTYEKLGTNIESISVVVRSDKDGEVKIIFADSPNLPAIFVHTYSYDHTVEFHRVVSKKGLYIKVQYTNGAEAQTSFQMKTYFKNDFEVEQTTEGGNDVHITNESLAVLVENEFLGVVVEGMNFTPEGALIVSGPTTGITGFALESTLNDIKTELTTNMPTKEIQTDTAEEVSLIRQQQTPLQHEQAYVDLLVEGPTMWADTVPAFTTHPSQKGWYWTNSTPSKASNIYFYANTQAKQTQYTISQVMNSYAVVKIADLTGTSSLPFLNVYSRPQGAGDHVPGFYRSAWVYTIPNTAQLSQIGNEFLLYWGELPSIKIHPTLRRVQATLALTRGPALQTETLQFLTVNTDSGAPVNTVDVIYSYLGYTTYGGLVHDIELGYGNQDTTRQLTSKLNTLSLESTQQQLKTQLDKLTFTGSNLLVSSSGSSNLKCNDVLLSQTPDGTKNCLDVQVNNNISGFATESTLNTILEVLGDNVPVINYGLLNDTPQYIPIKANADGEMLVNVQNQVDISPIATETTLSALSTLVTNQSAYSRFQTEAPVSDGKLDTIISNMSMTNFNVNNLTKCDTDNVAIPTGVSINTLPSITGTVSVDNFPGSFQISGPVSIDNYPVTQAVSISTAVPVINDTNTALDVHCYGVGSGNSMHKMSVDSQGKQNINLHDDQGNGISSSTNGTSRGLDVVVKGDVNANIATSDNGSLTSTSVTGTETYNALHVLTKGTTSVSGSVKTQAQDNNTNRVADNVSVVAPVQIGSSNDTEGYLWVSAIFSFASVSSGGTIYLEVSHDGSFWARPSSASTFIMSSMANVYGSIILTTPCPFRYVRLYADAPFSGLGCSAWFVMK